GFTIGWREVTTVTWQTAGGSPDRATEIFAPPCLRPTTNPLEKTCATAGSDELHCAPPSPVACSCSASPMSSASAALSSVTAARPLLDTKNRMTTPPVRNRMSLTIPLAQPASSFDFVLEL